MLRFRKLGATLSTLLQREDPLPQRTIPVLGAQARGRLFLRCPLDATSRGVKVVVEKLHEDEITVQVDDYAAAENLVKAYSTVGHAHHSIMSAMKGNKLGLKFEKKAIPVTSKEEEQKYGTLVTVTSVGLDMTFVRKLTNFIISSL
ncbi:uncharacterized protein LOC142575553 isoform X4 [Dermacentor variabilis]|uniref:uncharacterized protein LOC142575553 isoform X4 n=1 Tax=Dermacentor variabilis TaxID=34621 RepID=UPI003F5BB0AC